MKENNKKNYIAIIALCISILSLALSFVQFNYNIGKDQANEEEKISIINKSVSYDHVGKYKKFINDCGTIDGVIYNITISNNSKHKVSFLDYNFYINNNKKTKYSNMIKCITMNNSDISFPLILDSNEAITLSINVNVIIPKEVNDLVEKEFDYDTNIVFAELNKYLDKENIDLYGNEIKTITYENGERLVEIDNPRFPEYYFEITSSKGNNFSQIIKQ